MPDESTTSEALREASARATVSGPAGPPAPGASGNSATPGRASAIWKLAVSLSLLGLLVWTQDLGGVGRVLATANPLWLLAATAIMFVEQTLSAMTWGMLLTARGLKVGMGKVLHIYYLSFFLGTWLPSNTGPDFVRAYYLAKHVDGYEAVGSMLLLRFVSLLALGLFAVSGIYLVPSELPPSAMVLAWILVAGSTGAVVVGFTERPRRWATVLLDAIGLRPLSRILGKLHDALHAYRKAPGTLVVALAASLLVQFGRILTVYFAARALGATVPLSDYLVLVPVTTLITLLPISMAGFGVREGSFVYFFSRVGMAESVAFGLGLLVFGLSLVLWAVAAVLYWLDRP